MEYLDSHELDARYDLRAHDVALLNAREHILTYVDDRPNLPLTDEEIFDPAFHSFDSPSSLMDPASRREASLAFNLLTKRFTEITGGVAQPFYESRLGAAAHMLDRVLQEWKDRYLLVRANLSGLSEYTDWAENVLRFHDGPIQFSAVGETSTPNSILRAHSKLLVDVNNERQAYNLPAIVIAAPGVHVESPKESGCHVVRWDDICTGHEIQVPMNFEVIEELRKRGALWRPQKIPGLEKLIFGPHPDLRRIM